MITLIDHLNRIYYRDPQHPDKSYFQGITQLFARQSTDARYQQCRSLVKRQMCTLNNYLIRAFSSIQRAQKAYQHALSHKYPAGYQPLAQNDKKRAQAHLSTVVTQVEPQVNDIIQCGNNLLKPYAPHPQFYLGSQFADFCRYYYQVQTVGCFNDNRLRSVLVGVVSNEWQAHLAVVNRNLNFSQLLTVCQYLGTHINDQTLLPCFQKVYGLQYRDFWDQDDYHSFLNQHLIETGRFTDSELPTLAPYRLLDVD